MNIRKNLIYLKKLNFVKLFNILKYEISYVFSLITRRPVRLNYPLSLSVEPLNFCNLHCPQCPAGTDSLQRKKGVMDFSTFKRIIDESGKYLLNLFLYFQGEPFLNKDIFKMIEYANTKKIVTVTSTNGHYFTDENISNLIKSGLDIIIISLDGTTQDVYEKYRIGGNFDKVIKGIKMLVEAKQKAKSKKPFIELQFIVFSHNEHQMHEFKNLAKELKVDNYSFKSAQVYDYETNNYLLPKNKKYSRYIFKNGKWQMKKKIKNRCPRLWNSSVITWDGYVLPCCFDKDAKYLFGNIKNQDFKQIISGESFKKFAKTVLINRKSIDICNNCTE